ncbi:MAG: helix-turn-helix transcriptional regulator [Cryobacterium sp.]|nr:helix-turn-helix transcriptional regulator [Cryobacterium sp.]MCC7127906.1 helix-turn-helix transcriptional regulator [Microbacteriaceae bacterium]
MPATEPLEKRLGANLRSYRSRENVSQEKLALRIGLTPRYLAGIERGERNLTLDSVDALADRLGIDSSKLLLGDQEGT